MRKGSSGRRQRNRGNGSRRGNQGRSQVYDSNGPDVRIRGTAHQVAEKYMALAKDASASGDIIMAESYTQHAEHYQRIINSWGDDAQADNNRSRPQREQKPTVDKKEDLALPASILGGEVKPDSEEALA